MYHKPRTFLEICKRLTNETKEHLKGCGCGFYDISLDNSPEELFIVCCGCGKCIQIMNYKEIFRIGNVTIHMEKRGN